MNDTKLPVAKVPCKECPFRRDSIPGWLGGGDHGDATSYRLLAHSDANVACHCSPGFAADDAERKRPCAGLAIYRNNVLKKPRDGEAARACLEVGKDEADTVFKTPMEFFEHHDITSRPVMDRIPARKRA
jgi:hypothetical protein